jgi:D-beta-D-heptose 7-phosphate kinase/D-beta-D-heptose 1-phosphate adenosyltransferase
MGQVISLAKLIPILERLRRQGRKAVFTNGCFDILHAGHVRYLSKAGRLGDVLIVGLNSDSSVRRLKGRPRPVMPQKDRAEILAALAAVSYVVVFGEDTPLRLIQRVRPDILVKGGDYKADEIVGADLVRSYGGKTVTIPLIRGKSTTGVFRSIIRRYGGEPLST